MNTSMKCFAWLRVLVVALGVLLPFHGGHAQSGDDAMAHAVQQLSWVRGPKVVPIGSVAQFNVPAGFVFLDPQNTARFMELTQNPPTGREYLFAPEDFSWFAMFGYEAVGYVKDDEKVDPGAILASVRTSTEASNKGRRARGWSTMSVTGWRYPPYYDVETKRLEWAIDGLVDATQEQVINFNTRLLGRSGVTSARLVASPEGLEGAVRSFKGALRNFSYMSGERYTEFKQGDRVAEYGLTALIVGGTAAAAAKSGVLKSLWKFVVGGLIAAIVGLKALFSRKKSA